MYNHEEEESEDGNNALYTPLSCDFCQETYTLPADWVRHMESHEDKQPHSRKRKPCTRGMHV